MKEPTLVESIGCQCYPPDKYPDYMRKGCNAGAQCWVLAEMRQCRTPEGRSAWMAGYHGAIKKVAEESDKRLSAYEARKKIQKFGIPAMALQALIYEKPTAGLTAAKDWLASDRKLLPVLVLAGDVGQGKTVAAAWCATEWARDYPWNQLPGGNMRPPMIWLDGPRLRELSAFDANATTLLDHAARAELTIVDDAGRDGSPRAIEALSDVLMERIDNRRLTVLTSNLKGEQFRNRYGQALSDRFRAYAVIPKLTGKSLRGHDAR